MLVIEIIPGKEPRDISIRNDLATLQKYVGGRIETRTIHNLVILCNEDGKIYGLPYNFSIGDEDFVGNCLVTGYNSDELTDCPIMAKEFAEKYMRRK